MLLAFFISYLLFLQPTSATEYTAALRKKVSESTVFPIPPQLSILLGDAISTADRLGAADSLLGEIDELVRTKSFNNWVPVALSAIKNLCYEGYFRDSHDICNRCKSTRTIHRMTVDSFELVRIYLNSLDLEEIISGTCYSLTFSTFCESLLEQSGFRHNISLDKVADIMSVLQVFTGNAKILTNNGEVWTSPNLRLEKLLCILRAASPSLMKAFDTQDITNAELRAIMANAGNTDGLLEHFLNQVDFPLGFMMHLLPTGLENLRNMLSSVYYSEPGSGTIHSYLRSFSVVSPSSLVLLPPSTCATLLEDPSMVHGDFIPSPECFILWLKNIFLRGVKNMHATPVKWIVTNEHPFLQTILAVSRSAHIIPLNLPPIANLSNEMSRHIFGSNPNAHCHLLEATDLFMLKNTASLSHISASCFAQIKNIDKEDISELMNSFNDWVLALFNGTLHPYTTSSISARQLRHLASLLPQDQLICQDHSFIKNINPSAFHSLPAKCLNDYVAHNELWDFGRNTPFLFEPDMMELLKMRTMEDIFTHLNLDVVPHLPWDIASTFYQAKFTNQVVNEIQNNFAKLPPTSTRTEVAKVLVSITVILQFINFGHEKARVALQLIQFSIPEWLSNHLLATLTFWPSLIYARNILMLKLLLGVPENVDIQMPHINAYLDKCGITLKFFTALIQAPLLEEISAIFIRRRPQITDLSISFLSFAASVSSDSARQYLRFLVQPHVGTNLYEFIPGATLETHHMFLWMLFAPNFASLLDMITLPPISLSNTAIKVYRDSNERYNIVESYKFICNYPLTVLCPKSYIVTDGSADAGAVSINWIDQVIHGTLLNSNYGLKKLDSNQNYYKFPFLSSPTYGTFAAVVILKAKQLNMLIPFTLDPKFFKIMANLELMEHQVEEYFEEIYDREMRELENILKVDSNCLEVLPLDNIDLRTPVKSYPYLPIDVSLFGYSPETTLAQLKTNSSEYFSDIRNLALKNFKELIWNFRHYFGKIYAVQYLSFIQNFSCFESYFMPIVRLSALTILERFHYSNLSNEPTIASTCVNITVSPKIVFNEFLSLLEPNELRAFLATMTGSTLIDLRQVDFHLEINPNVPPSYPIEYAFSRKRLLSRSEFLQIMGERFPEFNVSSFTSLPELINENILKEFLADNLFHSESEVNSIIQIVFQPTITYGRFLKIISNLVSLQTGGSPGLVAMLVDNMQREIFYAAEIMACFNLLKVHPQPMRSLILSLVQQINSDPAHMDDGFARLSH